MIKSGCDFKELSLIELCIGSDKQSFVNKIEKCIIDSSLKENEKIKALVDIYFGMYHNMIRCDIFVAILQTMQKQIALGFS